MLVKIFTIVLATTLLFAQDEIVDRNPRKRIKIEVPEGVIQVRGPSISLEGKRIKTIAPAWLESEIEKTYFPHDEIFYFHHLEEEEMAQILAFAEDAEVLILFTFNAWQRPTRKELIQKLQKPHAMIHISLRDPRDTLYSGPDIMKIDLYHPTALCIDIAAQRLYEIEEEHRKE